MFIIYIFQREQRTIRVAAHERLRDLLNILRGILDRYTALKSADVHTAAVVLIAQIKGENEFIIKQYKIY